MIKSQSFATLRRYLRCARECQWKLAKRNSLRPHNLRNFCHSANNSSSDSIYESILRDHPDIAPMIEEDPKLVEDLKNDPGLAMYLRECLKPESESTESDSSSNKTVEKQSSKTRGGDSMLSPSGSSGSLDEEAFPQMHKPKLDHIKESEADYKQARAPRKRQPRRRRAPRGAKDPDYWADDQPDMELQLVSPHNQAKTAQEVTFRAMMRAGCHYGSRTNKGNSLMNQFMFGIRDGESIFDLTKSIASLRRVMYILQELIKVDANILFVGNSPVAKDIVRVLAKRANCSYINDRWMIGMLTNWNTMAKNARAGREYSTSDCTIEEMRETIAKRRVFREMARRPDFVVMLNLKGNEEAVWEAQQMRIPMACILDSDESPKNVMYPIPGNDDSPYSVFYFMDMMSRAIVDMREQLHHRREMLGMPEVTPADGGFLEDKLKKIFRVPSLDEMVNPLDVHASRKQLKKKNQRTVSAKS
eukprot:1009317_1